MQNKPLIQEINPPGKGDTTVRRQGGKTFTFLNHERAVELKDCRRQGVLLAEAVRLFSGA